MDLMEWREEELESLSMRDEEKKLKQVRNNRAI